MSKFLYEFARVLMRNFVRIGYRVRCEGRENVPDEGGYLFISNHRSMMDAIFIGLLTPKSRFCFLAKQELFRNRFFGRLIQKLGAVAVDRGAGDISPLEELCQRLRNGENCLIFPEGTRSKDGKLGRFKSGAALIAAQTGVPVVPVGISYKGRLHFRSRVLLRVGPAFRIPQTEAANPSIAVLKAVRQEMTANVTALLPPPEDAQTEPQNASDQKGDLIS